VLFSQNTFVPDDGFEQLLIDLGYDSGPLDDLVPTANINSVQSLEIITTNIKSLQGIEGFISLKTLRVEFNNDLVHIDISQNVNIETLSILNSPIEVLFLTTNTRLKDITIGGTSLIYLDLSNNDQITDLNLSMGIFQTINLRSGGNTIIQNFDATDNPNLSCVVVDDSIYSAANWTNIGFPSVFVDTSVGCTIPTYTYVPDDNFEQALITKNLDGVLDNYVLTSNIDTLHELFIEGQSIEDLTGIEDFVGMEHLQVNDNLISSIDVTTLSELVTLSIDNNSLSSLNLSQNARLENLFCRSNNLTSLHVGSNPLLSFLDIRGNQIPSIGLNTNTQLKLFYCDDNPITTLDLSQNGILLNLRMNNTSLTTVDFRNGNNAIVNSFNALNNPDLDCIFVDNRNFSQTNWTNIDAHTNFAENAAQCGNVPLTYVPDDNFEQALIEMGYDSGPLDDYVITANIEVITTLDISDRGIQDLTGIEDFTSLGFLDCSMNLISEINLTTNILLYRLEAFNNLISSIDITQNAMLSFLYISDNQLTSIDLSGNTSLKNLLISDNLLPSIDVSNNIALEQIFIYNNVLTSLDVTQNIELDELACQNNQLPSIDVTQNTKMTSFTCSDNLLTGIDVSKNILLEQFVCDNNDISAIDVSQNTLLSIFFCNFNELTSLDVTQNTALSSLSFQNNQIQNLDLTQNTLLAHLWSGYTLIEELNLSQNSGLISFSSSNAALRTVDIRNGSNTSLTLFNTADNPDLRCIFVDNRTYSQSNWTNIDTQSRFVETEMECDDILSCQITVDDLPDVVVDTAFTLPTLTNGSYYTLPGGNGDILLAGDIINTSQTIYIYNIDPTDASCFAESSFTVTINITVTEPSTDCTIPEFFTPNNDGINDLWNVNCTISTISSIHIFNRYGKLIYTLKPGDLGWNGTYQYRLIPSNTYWYRIDFENRAAKRGYFSLRR
jgi:gliding motility-associated-like protein